MKNKNYKHINKVEREEIGYLLKKGYSLRGIAGALGRSQGTISEEISNNSVKGEYDPDKANHKACVKRKYSKYQGMKIIERKELWDYVEEKLAADWSPQAISGRIKEVDCHLTYVSAKGIYKFIDTPYGAKFEKHLAYKGRERIIKKSTKVAALTDRVFIDERPKIVEKRRRFGDWEGDFIVSGREGNGVLLVLHERKARYVLIKKILGLTIETVHQYLAEMTGGLVCVNTLTLDNDIIFRKHKELSEILGVPVYFCHPYHSWEKGGVENTNKLIRRYIPKGGDISKYSDEYIKMIEDKLNNRPRACLNFKTPLEVMLENNQLKSDVRDMINFIETKNKKTPVFGLRG